MHKQEIFNTVANHLLSQNKQSIDEYGACRYRGPNGLKCAIGCLITDEEYKPEMEWRGISQLVASNMAPEKLTYNLGILSNLQIIHDYYEPNTWKIRLSEIARREGLNSSVLDSFEDRP